MPSSGRTYTMFATARHPEEHQESEGCDSGWKGDASDASFPAVQIHCPHCGKHLPEVPADYPCRPFCSPQCKLLDLANWFDEAYRHSTPLDLPEGAHLEELLAEGYDSPPPGTSLN